MSETKIVGARLDSPLDVSGSSQIRLADGAVGTPSLTFNSDTNTGVWRTDADSIGVATGGVNRLLITSTSIGTAVPTAIQGTTTNDNAAAGYVGEYISASVDTLTNYSTSGTWVDITSISLTAGDWDIYHSVYHSVNGATWSQVRAGVGITSGNNAPDIGLGVSPGVRDQAFNFPSSGSLPDTFTQTGLPVRYSISSTTTVYLKGRWVGSGGPPQYMGSIWARRAR
jgi:hypothetical protein